MTHKARSWVIALLILTFPFALFLASFVYQLSKAPPAPDRPLPDPNGYDDLVRAGEMVSSNSWNYDGASLERLREMVAANAWALTVARAGFSNECRVPVEYSEAYVSNHLSDLTRLKRLAQAFLAEGRLAELENRPQAAAKSYLDVVHLADVSPRGGPLIDGLVGIAIESLGTSHLQRLADRLDAKSCHATSAALESLDSQRLTWGEVMQEETDWSRRSFTGLRYELMRWLNRKSMKKNLLKAEQKFQEQQLKTRQLVMDLAARAYSLDKGHRPASAADLVPDYLKAVPQAPVTGTSLVYSPR